MSAPGEDVVVWLRRMLRYDIAVNTHKRRLTMTQVQLFKMGGDLYHGTCLTGALQEQAEEVDVKIIEEDDICSSCGEVLRQSGDDIPESPDVDDDEPEEVGQQAP